MERRMNDDFTISFIEISQNNTTSFLRRLKVKTLQKLRIIKYSQKFMRLLIEKVMQT